ncbi:efflux RND transporter periplasmic adaptor subunit [Rhodoblastus acidophilus]|uniref:Efflux RND transporter periplasmic adaptor subunit n=1 Tax=Candidatus Rhodoblastus alkanivorans TaxID=2954117 RepID=A0ABS9Z9E3_9HYPH|nr:efflux RND transporter periplasmic adaptor subunit [Candidatus Rhodoblastus alkanivorans]MCI4679696.1 efflux RND transporter periplasmic adaptor subunit [Candidatus Rhodoblastus alkanivorans]MCI4683242.1 efflux RND transporter periplasmic adaptor subunit [Candidatus Rhodoblastus alkanivorans]MDI4640554.1 efflux RND transporter periplasmic adaptor subunit [Rhodoblastus acidophilus]
MNESEIIISRREAGRAPGSTESPAHETGVGRPGGGRPWLFWIVLILLAAGGGWAWLYYHKPEPAGQTAADKTHKGRADIGGKPPVAVAIVAPRDIHVTIEALGTVTPLATVTVVSQIAGYLQEVAFKEGQHVKKGDFLAQIDPRPYQALKAQYEGQLARDQGALDQARADMARYSALLKQNSIAAQTAQNQKFVVEQAEGTVRADQALIAAQDLNITYAHIVSPVTGRIGLRLVDPGNYVQAGSTTGIAVITQMQPMSVIFTVSEDALDKILPKIRDGAKLVATAYDRANVKKLATGTVSALDSQIDTSTGMVKLRAVFDNNDEALFPNQFVNVRLLAATLKDAVAAPLAGIQHGAPGDYAYVIESGKATVRVVKLGATDGPYVQILSGLSPGDKVVVDGADRLREGAEVRVVSDESKNASNNGKPAQKAAAPSVDPPPAAGERTRR